MTDEEKKKLEELERKKKLEKEMKEKKAAIKKYVKKDDETKDDKKEDKDKKPATTASPGQLPPLGPEDEALVAKYKRQLAMRLPPPAVKHKMKKEKAGHLIPYVFPEEAAKFLAKQMEEKGSSLPPLDAEGEKLLAKYKKQLAMRLPPQAVKHKMKKEGAAHIIPYLFGEDKKKNAKNKDIPDDVKAKEKIKPNVAMLPFHWNKIKEKQLKSTIWYDIYHKYGKYKENEIFDLIKCDELFGKPKEEKKKKKSSKKKTTSTNAVPSVKILFLFLVFLSRIFTDYGFFVSSGSVDIG